MVKKAEESFIHFIIYVLFMNYLMEKLSISCACAGEWTAQWSVKDATDEPYRKFAHAQMDVYSQASFGWAYWTYNNPDRHWSLKDMIYDSIITGPEN